MTTAIAGPILWRPPGLRWPSIRRIVPEWLLKRGATGHLLRNAAGHLVHTCATPGCPCSVCAGGTAPCTLLFTLDSVVPCPGFPDPNGTYSVPRAGNCLWALTIGSGALSGYSISIGTNGVTWAADLFDPGTNSYLFNSSIPFVDCAMPIVMTQSGACGDPSGAGTRKGTAGTGTISS